MQMIKSNCSLGSLDLHRFKMNITMVILALWHVDCKSIAFKVCTLTTFFPVLILEAKLSLVAACDKATNAITGIIIIIGLQCLFWPQEGFGLFAHCRLVCVCTSLSLLMNLFVSWPHWSKRLVFWEWHKWLLKPSPEKHCQGERWWLCMDNHCWQKRRMIQWIWQVISVPGCHLK